MSEASFFSDGAILNSTRYEGIPVNDRYDRAILISRMVGPNRRVLELGCSTGFISKLLKQSGCHVVGLDVDPLAAKVAATICDRVMLTDLSSPEWPGDLDQKFDVIVMGDVLEHLVAPQVVLRNVRPLLDPDGYIVVSLPNVVHWTQRLKILLGQFRYQSTGLLDFTHLRFFDLRTARVLLTECGFEIVKFQPLIGGRLSAKMRPLWQALANCLPNLFGYQFLFKAQPQETSPMER
jgi:SAM-dependent methyltransferase